jgi:hypothetical protein
MLAHSFHRRDRIRPFSSAARRPDSTRASSVTGGRRIHGTQGISNSSLDRLAGRGWLDDADYRRFSHPTSAIGHWSLVTGQWSVVSGHWSVVTGHWSLVTGHWSLVTGHWSLVIGHWSLVIGYWSVVIGYWLLVTGTVGLTPAFWNRVPSGVISCVDRMSRMVLAA